ncbi:MAG TPA: asparaginase domain-containing protein [Xanthobacteraceae bacterium]
MDRLGIGEKGWGNLVASRADVDFYRALPPGGYTKGLGAAERTDAGDDDVAPEIRGRDFFPYKPYHLDAHEPRQGLARITNIVQRALATGKYQGAIWNQGSPRIEETIYWFNLVLDCTVPVCGNAAQRPHGQVSSDGARNLIDSVDYIVSRVWADAQGRNRAGAVLIQEQQVFAARDVQKGDARPGGYVTTGGHGGVIGAAGHDGPPTLLYVPQTGTPTTRADTGQVRT